MTRTTGRRRMRLEAVPATAVLALLAASCAGGSGPDEGSTTTAGDPGPTVEVSDAARTECGRTWEEAYGGDGASGEIDDGEIADSAPAGAETVQASVRTAAPPPDPELVQSYERRVLTGESVDGVLALELTLHGPDDATTSQRLEEVAVDIRGEDAERWVGHAVVDGVAGGTVPADPAVDVGAEPAVTTIEIEPWLCPDELGDEAEAPWEPLPDGAYYMVLHGLLEPEPGQASGPRGTWSTDHIRLTVEDGELSVADTRHPLANQLLEDSAG